MDSFYDDEENNWGINDDDSGSILFLDMEDDDMESFFKKGWLKNSVKKVVQVGSDVAKTGINIATAPARGIVGLGKNNELENKLQIKTTGSGFTRVNEGITKVGAVAGPAVAAVAGGLAAAPLLAGSGIGGILAKSGTGILMSKLASDKPYSDIPYEEVGTSLPAKMTKAPTKKDSSLTWIGAVVPTSDL